MGSVSQVQTTAYIKILPLMPQSAIVQQNMEKKLKKETHPTQIVIKTVMFPSKKLQTIRLMMLKLKKNHGLNT